METSSGKRLKKSSEADDKISKLPDDVLFHILSFIPTFDSVATCMLSSRWKHLWKHFPTLNFDDTRPPQYFKKQRFANFVNKVWTLHVSKDLEKLSLTCRNYYIYDIGNWVTVSITRNIQSLYLTIYSPNIYPDYAVPLPSNLFTCKTLEVLVLKAIHGTIMVNIPPVVCLPKLKTMELVGLIYKGDHQGNLIPSCVSLESLVVKENEQPYEYTGFRTISSSTLRDVELRLHHCSGHNLDIFCSALRRLSLSINCVDRKTIKVPGNVFTCETLEQLTLKGPFAICAPRTIRLPNVTFLALHRVEFEDDEIFSRLVSCCTSLESLVVTKMMEAELNISSRTLKVLEVNLHCKSKPDHKLVINAPALKCLKLVNVGYVDYQIEDLAFLEQAYVRLTANWPSDICSSVLTKAYQALRYVKNLSIYHIVSNVGVMEHVLPMFNRLTDLDITINGQMGYVFFQDIIKNSIKLENLSVELNVRATHDQYWMNDLNTVPVCLLSSLRCVSIRCFEGRAYELAMALYLLENSRMMEKVEVCFLQYLLPKKTSTELGNKILNVRRGSKTCDVVLKNW